MPERIVVIGGDAAGMSAVSQVRRRKPQAQIVAFERGHHTSYSACGIPYVVGGEVESVERLVVRSPQQFRDQYRVDVRTRHEVTGIDLDRGEVEVLALDRQRGFRLGFDQLVIATGARPSRPDLPGIDLPFVHGVQTLDDGEHLLEHARGTSLERVVVVGGGYIGLEMAEAFVHRGLRVTVVEAGAQVLRSLDPDMAALVQAAMVRTGIEVRVGQPVRGFEPGRVLVGDEDAPEALEADLVVLGLGVRPNSELAAGAGIALGPREAILVDRRQATSAPGVWAAGDCASAFHLVSGVPVHLPLGTVANKAGRVVGINLAGGYATFPGVVGTAMTGVCGTEVARTGLSEAEATAAGFSYVTATAVSTTRAGYFPGAAPVTVKLLAERRTGRLLGGQLVGGEGSAKRVDVLATALFARLDATALVDLDLGYAPPFSPVWDPLQTAGRLLLAELDRAR